MKHINPGRTLRAIAVASAMAATTAAASGGEPSPLGEGMAAPAAATSQVLTLDQCLTEAMHNSHRRPASKFAVAMAEAQHRQALAGYWPQLSGKAGVEHMNEAPDFLFPASSFKLPAQTIPLPSGFSIPLNGPGGITVPLASIPVPAQKISVPVEDVKLMDPDSFLASMNLTWLLYDGGMRKGFREQAQGWLEMSKQEARRTDLEIADSVKRYYYGSVLARQLHQVGGDTLARMEATLNLTETMYKEGSGKVKKTDFLDNKIMVESLRAMVAQLEKNEDMAQAALANSMGLPWSLSVTPADKELPYTPYAGDLDGLVSTAYEFSPDWAKIEAGIRAAEGAVRAAQSDYYPRVAVTGEVHELLNSYDAGIVTQRDKQGWTVGIGIEIPIFNGFITKNKVAESRARVGQINEQKFLLREGIGLQIKDIFLGIRAAQKSYQATLDAMTSATENRDLNTRAYQNELVETEKVIRAQLIEALMQAQHFKTRYDLHDLQSQLTLLVGTEVLKQLQPGH